MIFNGVFQNLLGVEVINMINLTKVNKIIKHTYSVPNEYAVVVGYGKVCVGDCLGEVLIQINHPQWLAYC